MRNNVGYEGLIAEVLTQEEKERIDKILGESSLSKREIEIIKHRFGLNTEPKDLEPIAKTFGITRERVRQIEKSALTKIKKRWTILSFRETDKILNALGDFRRRIEDVEKNVGLFGELAQMIVDKKEETEIPPEKRALYEKLFMPTSELELSVRSSRFLKEAGIKCLYQLVVMQELRILSYRNVGKKSLAEIESVLKGMGLTLGMKLDDSFNRYFRLRTNISK